MAGIADAFSKATGLSSYEPTLREKAQSWLAQNVFGDTRGGYDTARKTTEALEYIPPVGAAFGAYDFGRAFGNQDIIGAALAGMAITPGGKLPGKARQLAFDFYHSLPEMTGPAGWPVYHGSVNKGFGLPSVRNAVEAPAVFATNNPDIAELFTVPREYGEPVWDAVPGEVSQFTIHPRYPYEVPAADAQRFIEDTAFQTQLINQSRRRGHDVVVARGVNEGFGGEAYPGDVYAILQDNIMRRGGQPGRE